MGAPAARAAGGRRRARGRARRHGRPALPRARDPRPRRGRLSRRLAAGSLPARPRARGAPSPGSALPAPRAAPDRPPRHPRAAPPPAARAPVPAALATQLALFPPRKPRGTGRRRACPDPPCRARRSPRPRTACSRRAASSTARVSQATERLILSYPRADARTGRERLPSLFFVAAAAALAGRPLAGAELERLVVEDDLDRLPLEDALDARRARPHPRAPGRRAPPPRSRPARRSSASRAWRPGALVGPAHALRRPGGRRCRASCAARLDPLAGAPPISASRLATYARCGFQYLLQHVLRLEPALEPEERRRLDPLERGNLFHDVAERFLRERRDRGELPVRDTEERASGCSELAEEALDGLVAGSPPRFTLLWEREKRALPRDAAVLAGARGGRRREATPAHFELSFGLGRARDEAEPHHREPLEIDLGDGRTLRVSGQIDRIDRRARTASSCATTRPGERPADDGGVFRGGKQLQIPFYVLAAASSSRRARSSRPSSTTWTAGGRSRSIPSSRQGRRSAACCAAWWTSSREGSSCRSRPPATSATSRRCAGRRRCCSAGRRSRSATRRCRSTCG